MKVAVIDLGTNTFHLLFASVENNAHEILHRERKAVKIGEKGINKGEITSQAWERALEALNEFKFKIEQEDVNQIFATATSAIRNAKNGAELVEEIKKQTGIEVEVISGIREAELIHLGARKALDLGNTKNLIMDIGGGSIEFIIADKEKAHWMHSFEIGGQRLVEIFHKSDPIAEEEIKELHQFFKKELMLLIEKGKAYRPTTLIGCSGTFDTLSDIHCESQNVLHSVGTTELPLPMDAFDRIHQELITKTREERLQIPGMIEMRVEMIVVASIMIRFVIDQLNISHIRVSSYALKEGILFDALDKIHHLENSEK